MKARLSQVFSLLQGITVSFVRLWRTRDELSIKNIRPGYLHYFLPMVIVLTLLDQRNTYFNVEPYSNIFGINVANMVYGVYCAGSFIVLLLFMKDMKYTPKVFSGISLIGFLLWIFLQESKFGTLFIILFQFGLGGCAIYATYAYVFILRNAERLFGILIVTFNYGLFIYLNHHSINNVFLSKVLPLALTLLLVVCIFRFSKKDFPDNDPKTAIRPPRGIYISWALPLAFFTINIFGEAIVNNGNSGFGMRGVGAIIAVVISLMIQFIFRRSVWHMLYSFLLFTIVGVSLMAFPFMKPYFAGGAMLFGIGDGLGYIMVFYMTGIIKRYRNDLFFKRTTFATVVALIIAILTSDFLMRFHPDALPVVAVIVAAFFLCMFFILSPIVHHNIFSTDWIEDFRLKDITEIKEQLVANRAPENPLPVDLFGDFTRCVKTLTPTERTIFNYCLEDKTNKEILSLMYISISTLKTHNSHIYAKLNISSRDELSLYIELIKKSGKLSDIQ